MIYLNFILSVNSDKIKCEYSEFLAVSMLEFNLKFGAALIRMFLAA